MLPLMSELVSELISADSGRWIGEHAWGIYLVGLGTLLPMLPVCYFMTRHIRQDHQQNVTPYAFFLSAGIIACCITGFTVIATAIAQMETLCDFDAALSGAIAMHTPPAAMQFFAWITHAGDTLTYTVICIASAFVMLLQKRYLFAYASIVAIGGNAILNRSLKALFERARPAHEHGLIEYSLGEHSLLERGVGAYQMVVADGWSFPSGHTSGAVVTYGILAYMLLRLTPRAWHSVILLSVIGLVFTIGSSRIFLQVHYLSDVVAGFLSGLCWLTICITGLQLIERHQKNAWNDGRMVPP